MSEREKHAPPLREVPCPTCKRVGRIPKAYPDGTTFAFTAPQEDEQAPLRALQNWMRSNLLTPYEGATYQEAVIDMTAEVERRLATPERSEKGAMGDE